MSTPGRDKECVNVAMEQTSKQGKRREGSLKKRAMHSRRKAEQPGHKPRRLVKIGSRFDGGGPGTTNGIALWAESAESMAPTILEWA